MNWFYAFNGEQRGPVDDAELDRLVAEGTVLPSTLVWREGMANWVPHAEARPTNSGQPFEGGVVCAGCGASFREDEVVKVQGRHVCAACKPRFLQQLMEGVAMPSVDGRSRMSEEELLRRDYTVDISGCLSRSIETFKADPWVTIGASVLAYIALMAGAFVPFIGGIIQLFIQGPIMGGVWNFYLRKARSQPAGVADAFSGFGPRFWQLFFVVLVPGLILGFCAMLLIVPLGFGGLFLFPRHGAAQTPQSPPVGLLIGLGAVFLVVFLVVVAIQLLWMFAVPLVMDKGYGFWPAMELSRKVVSRRFWSTLLFFFVAGIIGMAGVLACGVGVLATGPVAFGMLVQHYERVFGELAPRS